MMNAERSPTFYRFDSAEQFRVWREMDDNDEEPVVIYHSHTATEAYPSRTDISYASEPQAHYVLVSPGTRTRPSSAPTGSPTAWSPRSPCRGGMIPCPGGLDAKDRPDNPVERCSMAIEVRIPTILRTYTDGAKQVEGTDPRSGSCSPTWSSARRPA
jgi:Predicted metal-dependent protease of the PAD1/JAB1 superfamily